MYLDYFDLVEEPFATTPDPKFLYKSAVHQEALDRIMTSVSMRRGINAIIGEPGLGKSMLIRTMLKGFSDNVRFAWVFNTNMDARDLIKYICRDFGFMPQGSDLSDLLMELYTFLIHEYEQKNYTILIIDEAQNCRPEVLEEIRQLSNLETVSNKLLQVILSGQPQLDVYLNEPSLHQLKQRISLKATLHRLGWEDTVKYIHHRLQVAGAKRTDIFTEAALGAVYEISDGVPRLINQVCDNAMLSAAQQGVEQIDSVLVMELLDQGKVVKATSPAELSQPRLTSKAPTTPSGSDGRNRANVKATPSTQKKAPAVVLEIMDGFDGVDLGELDAN